MIAKVVVDVPVMDTDRTYDYLIPPNLSGKVKVGSRVVVPFGPRSIQGFVVELVQQPAPDAEQRNLKEITSVPDEEPPLTGELVELALWMSRRYICYLFTALQSMVPAAMRSTYKRWVSIPDDPSVGEQLKRHVLLTGEGEDLYYDLHRGRMEWEQIIRKYPDSEAFLQRWVKEGWVHLDREVGDRITRKKVTVVKLLTDEAELKHVIEELPAQAMKQRDVLNYFLHRPGMGGVALKQLLQETSTVRGTVQRLVERGVLVFEEVDAYRDPYEHSQFQKETPPVLTRQQQRALAPILSAIENETFEAFLLHGVTGSGKTEIYLQAIAEVLKKGKEAIVLVPEISLTPQMVRRFKGRFGDRVAVLHSRLSTGERYDEWRRIKDGRAKVAVGARSAIFAPFRHLGLIIIDEEHESSYKQEENPRYHARDIAWYRGRKNHAAVIYGSATPSLETYDTAKKGKITYLSLQERIGNRPLPQVELIDMREELRNGNRSMFSNLLKDEIDQRLKRKEQMVLFLNRRGFSTFVMCRSCGAVSRCPHCDISLTYHRYNKALRCHYCGYAEREPQSCSQCGSTHIRYFGTGTQRVEEELSQLFPGIRIIRMDVDTTSRKGAHEQLLNRFQKGQGDVLLGTQMIAKGLDFERVSLVGVIAADTVLHLPDFRSAEKTFQLLTQVGGRAGRHQLEGKVVIQTYTPEHYSIQFARNHDYRGFYEKEILEREKKGYPPFTRIILFTLSHEEATQVVKTADQLCKILKDRLPPTVTILGPVPSPVARIKNRYRFQCMLKYGTERQIPQQVAEVIRQFELERKKDKVQIVVDVDPQVMM